MPVSGWEPRLLRTDRAKREDPVQHVIADVKKSTRLGNVNRSSRKCLLGNLEGGFEGSAVRRWPWEDFYFISDAAQLYF